MKPLVYFDFKEYEHDINSVVISKARLEEIIEQVYQNGYEDGSLNKKVSAVNYRDTLEPRNINKIMN